MSEQKSTRETHAATTPRKGRPTPTRKEAEAARRRPLVPADRKEAKQRNREARRRERELTNEALETGEEAHMPAQHRGKQRRLARDYIDSRWSIGELIMPLALVFMLALLAVSFLSASAQAIVVLAFNVVLIAALVAVVVDGFLIRRRLRSTLTERFGSTERGVVSYAIMRSIQLRRWRLPKPQIERHGSY